MAPKFIRQAEFTALTKPDAGAVIVNFTASWCGTSLPHPGFSTNPRPAQARAR